VQPHWLAVPQQFAPAEVEPETAEADLLVLHQSGRNRAGPQF
jgi:hypothetical protein